MAVLNHSHEGAPVRDIRQPSFEAAAKKMGIVLVDGYGRSTWRYVSREHIVGSRPDTIHWSVRRKQVEILAVQSRQPSRWLTLGFLVA